MKRGLLLGNPVTLHPVLLPFRLLIELVGLDFQGIGAFLPFIQNRSSYFSLLSCCVHPQLSSVVLDAQCAWVPSVTAVSVAMLW